MQVIYSDTEAMQPGDTPDMPNIGGLNVNIVIYDGFQFPYHSHDFNELILVLGGTGRHLVNGDSFQLLAGDVFVLKGGDEHSLTETRSLKFCNIAFVPEKLAPLGSDVKGLPGYQALFVLEPLYRSRQEFKSRLRLGPGELQHTSELAATMEKEYRAGFPATESMLNGYFMQLIVYLCRQYTRYAQENPRPLFALANAISYIESSFTEDVRLEQLAAMANLSVNQFLRIFQETFRTSPMNCVRQLRLRKACELLRRTDLTISQVASAVGIPDSNYFARIFKHTMGQSPREYRKK